MGIRGRVAWLVLTPLLAACGAVPAILPDDPTAVDDLDRWDGGATFSEAGPGLVLTFGGWPAPNVPIVFVCTKGPSAIFDASGDGGLVLGADPDCVGVSSELDAADRSVTVRIDRSALPAAFGSLDIWKLALVYEDEGGQWSIVRDIPADLPGDG